MGRKDTPVNGFLKKERMLSIRQPQVASLFVLISLLAAVVLFTLFPPRPLLLRPLAAYVITNSAWGLAALWFFLGPRLLGILQRRYYDHYLRLLKTTDLLYLALEHERPVETRPLLHRPIRLVRPAVSDSSSLQARLRYVIKHFDKLAAHLAHQPDNPSAGITCFNCSIWLLFMMAIKALGGYQLGFGEPALSALTLLPFLALMFSLQALPQALHYSAKWLATADVLLGNVDP